MDFLKIFFNISLGEFFCSSILNSPEDYLLKRTKKPSFPLLLNPLTKVRGYSETLQSLSHSIIKLILSEKKSVNIKC